MENFNYIKYEHLTGTLPTTGVVLAIIAVVTLLCGIFLIPMIMGALAIAFFSMPSWLRQKCEEQRAQLKKESTAS